MGDQLDMYMFNNLQFAQHVFGPLNREMVSVIGFKLTNW